MILNLQIKALTKTMKRIQYILISLLISFSWLTTSAESLGSWCKQHKVFTGLDAGITLGSTGIGVDVSSPLTKWVNMRAGILWLPEFKIPMNFNLNTYSDGIPTGNFSNVANMVYENTGIEMDEVVHTYGTGTMLNFKLLFDVFPIPANRHWHLTAGFLLGNSQIGKAYNTYGEKPTLVGLNIYNRAYEYFTHLEDIFDVTLGGGTYMDPELVEDLQQRFNEYGRMGIHIGDFKDGSPYIMDPAPDGSVTSRAFVNRFKPYLGAGYATDLDKKGKWHFGAGNHILWPKRA